MTNSVTFGPNPGTSVAANRAGTRISADAPAGTGDVNVDVTSTGGTATAPASFDYTSPASIPPVVQSVKPLTGESGTVIEITGTGFDPGNPAAPALVSVSPSGGPIWGGYPVTITGTSLIDTDAVHMDFQGDVPPTLITDTEISFIVPRRRLGSMTPSIYVRDTLGNRSNAVTFIYTVPSGISA